ncbi:hypothetical protein C8R46DRAFT_1088407 [Mycena filopes]|nr:hypothetical protein C8R46DRAFT_1088407 [Mycena filopes]
MGILGSFLGFFLLLSPNRRSLPRTPTFVMPAVLLRRRVSRHHRVGMIFNMQHIDVWVWTGSLLILHNLLILEQIVHVLDIVLRKRWMDT